MVLTAEASKTNQNINALSDGELQELQDNQESKWQWFFRESCIKYMRKKSLSKNSDFVLVLSVFLKNYIYTSEKFILKLDLRNTVEWHNTKPLELSRLVDIYLSWPSFTELWSFYPSVYVYQKILITFYGKGSGYYRFW